MVKKQLISKEHSDRSYSIEEKKPKGIGQIVQGKIKIKRMGLSNGDTQSKQASIQHNVQGRVPSVPADSPSAGSHMMQSRPVDKKAKRREEKRANRRRALANTLLPLTRKPQEHSDTLRHSEGSIQEHVFTVIDDRDHAETPLEAYRDLEPILFRLATLLGKTKNTLKIYDPYYCAGAVKRNLALLGFTDVYNKNEDFYKVQASNSCPVFDVLITNPPFSGDHMERVVQFAAKSGKPWALLMPDFVSKKKYYSSLLQLPDQLSQGQPDGALIPADGALIPADAPLSASQSADIIPSTVVASVRQQSLAKEKEVPKHHFHSKWRRDKKASATDLGALESVHCGPIYYLSPKNRPYMFSCPEKLSDPSHLHKFTPASFQCVWFLGLGKEHADSLTAWWLKKYSSVAECVLAGCASALPQLAKDPKKKRKEEAAQKKEKRTTALTLKKARIT